MDLDITDHLLCSTRSVRKRLDFSRPVEPALIERCIEIALQSPTGSNAQGWHFVVVTDAKKRAEIGRHYRECFEMYLANPEMRSTYGEQDPRAEQMPRVISSATWLAQHMHEAPVLLIPCIEGRVENAGPVVQASVYGSILPATWSFMLAARARGLGSAWTTLHILREREIQALLGIPDTVTQAALLPVAYFTGTDFRPAKRLPVRDLTSWNTWGARRS
jgi:nitroreductase